MPGRQPALHRAVAIFAGPTQAWSSPEGEVGGPGDGLTGFFHSDVRILSRVRLTLAGADLDLIGSGRVGADRAIFLYAARADADPCPDPLVIVTRSRHCAAGRIAESIEIRSDCLREISGLLRLDVASDLAGMDAVKNGRPVPEKAPVRGADGAELLWRDDNVVVRVTSATAQLAGGGYALEWPVALAPGDRVECAWEVTGDDAIAVLGAPARPEPEWSPVHVAGGDAGVARLLESGLADLAALRSALPDSPGEVFLAGGIPWFQTLFGRDSIWAAQLLLPLTWEVAAGTLRALASLQGSGLDRHTSEQPGKIPHEIRRAPADAEQRPGLPPIYYGTIDATVLWIGLLHDAWRAGMPPPDVAGLLPSLERALGWIVDHGDADGDGLLEYLDESGAGLSNQGWKDSGDAVQYADGSLAHGPIALVEVQGYAYRALRVGADLLDAFGRPGGQACRARAEVLRARFHDSFWLRDAQGAYLAMALDGSKRPVDAVASNMGHVLGSGLLDDAQIRSVAERVMRPDLFSGYGIRTLSTEAGRYWPLRYHGGTVWPHDSLLIAQNLVEAGFAESGRAIARGLLDAAEDFDYRLPELFSGHAKGTVPRAMPYPGACPVTCWSAASAIAVASILGALPG